MLTLQLHHDRLAVWSSSPIQMSRRVRSGAPGGSAWRRTPATLLLVCLLLAGTRAQELPPASEREVLRAQDLRDITTIRGMLRQEERGLVLRAALAAGSVQDTALTAPLTTVLRDRDPLVRSAAAFALGQTGSLTQTEGRNSVSDLLADRLGEETHPGVLCAIIEAVGKAGDAGALARLLAVRPRPVPDSLDGEIALSIGRMAYRGIKSRDATAYAIRLLDLAAKGERWKPAYALMRVADRELLDEHASRIAAAALDTDPDVRMFCASALGKISDRRVALLTLLRLAAEDRDWRVQANALKALAAGPSPSPEAVLALIEAVEDSNKHITIAALAALSTIQPVGTEQAGTLHSVLSGILRNRAGRFSLQEQKEAALSLAKLFGGEAYSDLEVLRGGGRPQRIAYAGALAYVPTQEARSQLLEMATESDPSLLSTTLEALTISVHRSPAGDATTRRIRSAMRGALRSDDVKVLAAAAAGLADSLIADKTAVPELLLTLQRLRVRDHAEAIIAIAEALGAIGEQIAVPTLVALSREKDRSVAEAAVTAVEAITGKPHHHLLSAMVEPEYTNFDWDLLTWIRRHPDLTVRTSRGTFFIRLMPDQAPFTCMAIATLVRKRFYDGLTFHRVVPNFVIQGGDPRGDGWGGPGFSIRSEFGTDHYNRGTVGIARSGKDSEGSQFFVTHSRQPHLDGRYTILGMVTGGMEVVDRVQIGDRIYEISFTAVSDSVRGG